MKKTALCIALLIGILVGTPSAKAAEIWDDYMQRHFSITYDRLEKPDAEQLSIIRYILQNTQEINIHQMRGETDNTVYVQEDGSEAVYDKDGNIVKNFNQGGYNFYSNETEPIQKFLFDVLLWLQYGSADDDPPTPEERLYYYTLDLDRGIQEYVFIGSEEILEFVLFDELSDGEKEVYYLFLELLFSESYSVSLSRDNIQSLRQDGDFYYTYFNQIQEALHVLQTDEGLPIDVAIATFDEEIDWTPVEYTHDGYSFAIPENWQIVDGAKHDLINSVFLVPPDTDMDNFRFSAHVAIEVMPLRPEEAALDLSDENIQKQFFASQIISTYSKMSGLSELEFSVWESENGYVYIATFQRSNEVLTIYQTTYYVMRSDKMAQVQATYFGEDSIPDVNEVARHLIRMLAYDE